MLLRVRHLACLAPPRMGGIGAAALRLCEGLQERGIQAELAVPQVAEGAPTHPLIRPWPSYLVLGNGAIFKSVRALFDETDVVHLHYPFFGVAEFLLLMRPLKPVVVTFHMDAEPEGWRYLFVWAQRKLLQPYLLGRASKILAASFDYIRSSSASVSLGADPSRWEELPFFVDDAVYVPIAKTPSDRLRVLFVGVLDRAHLFKGVREALEAIAQVPEAVLTIVGDGDQRAVLEGEAKKRGIEDRVVFVGKISTEDLIRAYQAADVLLFPSTNKAEAFGLVALEAQACGTPVIASNLPGVRTVVKDGETGILVQPGSVSDIVAALKKIRGDAAWREQLGRNARTHVEARFRRSDILDRHVRIYQELCALPS